MEAITALSLFQNLFFLVIVLIVAEQTINIGFDRQKFFHRISSHTILSIVRRLFFG